MCVHMCVPGMSGVSGAALWEVSCINRSLSALSDVLGALAEQRPHVPYRNSKLTHLLQDAIGDACRHTHTLSLFMTYESCFLWERPVHPHNVRTVSSSREIPHINIPTYIHINIPGGTVHAIKSDLSIFVRHLSLPLLFSIFSTRWRRQAAGDAVRLSHAALHHRDSAVAGPGHAGPPGPEGAAAKED